MSSVCYFGLRISLPFIAAICIVTSAFSQTPVAPASVGTHFSTDVAGLYKTSSEVKSATGTDVVVLADEQSYVFDNEGRVVQTQYLLYRVLTQKGAEGWDEVSQDWEPWHQERPSIQ